ncbi:hypothetical protein PR003_g25147 [Phytophthora rubi]|uniref:Thioredoxin domain-containing protein n=1 Tax=Phytophthora rubi TaxID=129364 RepID=A0A6A4CRE4_9STRA|nr:hypothetical protein PR003_g25147 [Phytophthora rubi]
MTVRALTLLFAVALVVRAAEFEEGDDVVLLMVSNFDETVSGHDTLLGDATVKIKLTEQFATHAFPTLKLFNLDVDAVKDYDGGRTSAEIENELVRARMGELDKLREMLEKIQRSLGEILAVQLELQDRFEEKQERIYELKAELHEVRADQDDDLSFGVLLEMAVSKLKL